MHLIKNISLKSICLTSFFPFLALSFCLQVMGRLTPGMNLLSNNRLLYRYCIFKRILEFPFLSINSVAAKMGANVQPTSQYLDGISEFDAITIGAYTNSGGFTCFKCVDLEGEIHPITIASSVNSGHTTFFPGCVIEEGVQLGNETSVPMNSIVPKDHQLQVGNFYQTFLYYAQYNDCIEFLNYEAMDLICILS